MASDSEDDVMNAEGDDDLFGDEEGEKVRELSDRELDSGDDEERNDRAPPRADAEEMDYDTRDARILDSTVWRHPVPTPADGEVSFDFLLATSKLTCNSLTSCDYPSFSA